LWLGWLITVEPDNDQMITKSNNKGNRNRRFAIVSAANLGFSRGSRATNARSGNALILDSRLVMGSDAVPTATASAILKRVVQGSATDFGVTLTSGNGTLTVQNIMALEGKQGGQTTARFNQMRIQRVEVWGTAVSGAVGSEASTLIVTNVIPGTDFASWVDTGSTGAVRPHVAFIPNLAARQSWLPFSAATDAVRVSQVSTASLASDITFRITADFR
jgi:hypothetical protein